MWKKLLFLNIFFIVIIFNVSNAFAILIDNTYAYPLNYPKVVNRFYQGENVYSAGHRGVDFYAEPGTRVFSIAAGKVIFAGKVAGGLHVTILHAGNIKSTYTFLKSKAVNVGEIVTKNQLLGTASGINASGDKNVFMLTMRSGDNYVDPLLFIKNKETVRDIHLEKTNESFSLNSLSEKQNLNDFFIGAGLKGLRNSASVLEKINKFIYEHLSSMVSEGENQLSRAIDGVKTAINKLNREMADYERALASGNIALSKALYTKVLKTQKVAYKDIVKAIKVSKKYIGSYVKGYKLALQYGLPYAKYYIANTQSLFEQLVNYQKDLVVAVSDWLKSAYVVSKKQLDQYVDVDLSTLLREIALPISCLKNACTMPVQFKCDVIAKFKVDKRFEGSGNSVMFVSGINSKGSTNVKNGNNGLDKFDSAPIDFPWKKLGYGKNDVNYYSYNNTGEDFTVGDSFQDLNISAKKFDEQVKNFKIKNPNRKLDLITHSQGGAIVGLWLANYFDPNSKSYPDLGNIIMYAPPLRGTSLSNAGNIIDSNQIGEQVHNFISDTNSIVPSSNDLSVKQLNEGGDIDKTISGSPLLKKVKVHIIRASSDLYVSAASKPIEGIDETIVDTDQNNLKGVLDPFFAHSDITTNDKTTAIAQRLLQGQKPPCVPPVEALKTVFKSASVHSVEVYLGNLIHDSANADYGENTYKYINSIN